MAETTVEEWRVIEQAPQYAISNFGRVKRLVDSHAYKAGSMLTIGRSYDGYASVQLKIGGKTVSRRVHNLICRAWHGNPPSPQHHAAHTNGDKLDNRPENLRWATAGENNRDIYRHGRGTIGDRNGRRTEEGRKRAEAIKAASGSHTEVARRFGVSIQCVSSIRRGLRWADSH